LTDKLFAYNEKMGMDWLSFILMEVIWYTAQQKKINMEKLFDILSIDLQKFLKF